MVIDEKGRLFGKINIIDLIIILVIVTAVLVVGINFIKSRGENKGDLLEIKFFAEEINDFVADIVKVGDQLYDDTSSIMLGTVTEVRTGAPESWANTSDGRYVKAAREGFKSITITGEIYGAKTPIGATVEDVKYGVGHSMVLRAGDAKIYLRISDITLKEKANASK